MILQFLNGTVPYVLYAANTPFKSLFFNLEDGLVVPLGVDLAELGGDPVVLPHEESVYHSQNSLLVNP